MTTRSDTGGAFPLLPINLDASAGPLSFLSLTDRTRAEATSRGFLQATRAPPLWREFDSRKDIGVQQLQVRLDDTLFLRAFLRKSPQLSLLRELCLFPNNLSVVSMKMIGITCPNLTLHNYLPCHGSLERPPGRLNMKEALVAHPPPWLIT